MQQIDSNTCYSDFKATKLIKLESDKVVEKKMKHTDTNNLIDIGYKKCNRYLLLYTFTYL